MVDVLRLAIRILALFCVVHVARAAPVMVAPTPSGQEFGLDEIGTLLTRTQHVEARFVEEHYSTLLSTPLKTEGVLGFTPPARLEKHVTSPHDELFIADGDKVFIVNKTEGSSRNIAIDDYPALRAFVEAFRSMLAGRVDVLQRFFDVSVSGTRSAWQVIARPREAQMQTLVKAIRFVGVADRVERIDIDEAAGDRSEMRITAPVP